jgi:hypothetical protein
VLALDVGEMRRQWVEGRGWEREASTGLRNEQRRWTAVLPASGSASQECLIHTNCGAGKTKRRRAVWNQFFKRKTFRAFFDLLIAVVGNFVSCLRVKSETKNVTPDTAFRFNSKERRYKPCTACNWISPLVTAIVVCHILPCTFGLPTQRVVRSEILEKTTTTRGFKKMGLNFSL